MTSDPVDGIWYPGYHLETRGFRDCGHCCVLSLCPCWTSRMLVAKPLPSRQKVGRIFFVWQAQVEIPEDTDSGDFPPTGTAWHSTIKLTVKKLHPFRQPQMKKFSRKLPQGKLEYKIKATWRKQKLCKKKIAKTIIDNLCKIRKDITSMKQEQNAIEKEHLTEQKPFLEN